MPSLLSQARRLGGALNKLLGHPNAAVALEADNLLIRAPAVGATWTPGTRQRVAWQITGVLGHPVDVHLVPEGAGGGRTEAVLATGIDPTDLAVTVTVPDLPPGAYRVLITSADPLDAHSPPLTLTPVA